MSLNVELDFPTLEPVEEIPYTGFYPDMVEFERPWEGCIQVGQGAGKVSIDGTPLQSESFSKCTGLLLTDASGSSEEAALFHIDDVDLNHNQRGTQSGLGGEYDAVFLQGTHSRRIGSRLVGSNYFQEGCNIGRVRELGFDTGNLTWDVVYKPGERKLYVNTRSQKKVIVYEI